MNAALLTFLAQAPAPPGAERGEEFGKSSPIALVVILLLLVATVLLIRSMGKHLRKVPASFEEPDGAEEAEEAEEAEDREHAAEPAASPEGDTGTGDRHAP